MQRPPPLLFALNASRDLGNLIAVALNTVLAEHEEREFDDGEHKVRALVDVQRQPVAIVQSLDGDERQSPADRFIRLLFFIGAIRDAGASRVTAIIPYLGWARKDRRTQPHDPISSRYVAQLLEAVGVDEVMTIDVHNPAAFDNAFRVRARSLNSHSAFLPALIDRLGNGSVAVASPDPGGVKRAQLFREALELELDRPIANAWIDKRRTAGVVSGNLVTGDVGGCDVVIVDDMISTGGTLLRAAEALRGAGARSIIAMATHGLMLDGSQALVERDDIDMVIVSDSTSHANRLSLLAPDRAMVVPVAQLFAAAMADSSS